MADTTTIPPRKRDVTFQLTPLVAGVPSGGQRLWLARHRPGQAIHALLQQVGVGPGVVDVSPTEDNWPAIHQLGDEAHVYAFVREGLAFTEAAQALIQLQQRSAA